MAGMSESAGLDCDGAGPSGRRRGIVAAVGVLMLLAGVLAFLIMAFQPFADAAGGCGGG